MNIDIYTSERNSSRFYVVPSETDPSILPDDVLTKSQSTIDIEEGIRLVGLDGTKAIRDIEQNGFHVAYVHATFDEMISTTDTVVLERSDK